MILLCIVLTCAGIAIGWGASSYHSHWRGTVSQLVNHIEKLETEMGRRPKKKSYAHTTGTDFPFSHSR